MIKDTPITFESNEPLSEEFRAHGRAEILKMAEKYFGRLISANIHFTGEGLTTRCNITVQMGGLPLMSADASSKEVRIAFQLAIDKLIAQLRRMKTEMREDKPQRNDKGLLPDGSRML